ncbi:hypothetical protein FUAX_52960 (plasmid) [Fulvitalea axinellae]|uniref:Uncharacterized protein n=1 Tax=Fulvitalea axinellae TaxID=1182444 RepID=A0AAU9D2Q6_9BACT|nr:hypothetical protein FUAX_52960 [Fulvitalea axinellae]
MSLEGLGQSIELILNDYLFDLMDYWDSFC